MFIYARARCSQSSADGVIDRSDPELDPQRSYRHAGKVVPWRKLPQCDTIITRPSGAEETQNAVLGQESGVRASARRLGKRTLRCSVAAAIRREATMAPPPLLPRTDRLASRKLLLKALTAVHNIVLEFAFICAWLGSLLVALLAISVQSAPTMMEDRRLNTAPKWMNPCGFAAEEFEGDVEIAQLKDETLLGNIVMQAKTALNYAQGFRDDYIKRTFNTDYADLHLTWKDNHYDWLPGTKQIPKQLGQQLDKEFLDKLEVRMLDTALLDAYEYMQRYAVGLEQIAWDQDDYGLDFQKDFKNTEYNLRSVLCELQMALAERGVAPRADVTREVMPRDYRDMSTSATYRNLRDWLIFRDYMNGLEYIIEVFEHFVRGIQS